MMGRQDRDQRQLFYEFSLDEMIPTDLSLSQTQSDWQLIENRAMLRDDRACPAHCFDSRRSVSVVDSARGGNPDVAAADKRSAANRS